MRSMKLLLIICLLLVVSRGMVLAETTAPTAVITVNSEGDAGYLPGVSCVGANECTLRQAIALSNGTAATDTILFDTSSFPNGMVIEPNSQLPDITDPVIIDGVTGNPGSCTTITEQPAELTVTLDGSSAGQWVGAIATSGFPVTGQDVTIKGLSIVNFNGAAIRMEGSNITAVCNFLGLLPDGVEAGNGFGVWMTDGANQVVGGSATADRNIISGNGTAILVDTSNFAGRIIQGNYIGLDANGSLAAGNFSGIRHAGSDLIVRDNVIAANGGIGIESVSPSTSLVVAGNIIGLNAWGSTARGNGNDGIRSFADVSEITDNIVVNNEGDGIYVASDDAIITGNTVGLLVTGSTGAGNDGYGIHASGDNVLIDNNTVSDNGDGGIYLSGNGAVITNNRIGSSADGNSPLGNQGSGIYLYSGSGAQIGGTPSERNIIVDNITGILMSGSSTTGAIVESNYIGVGADGSTAIGNRSHGITIGSGASGNVIGTPAYKNVIAHNSLNGIFVTNDDTVFNDLRHNIIFDNGALGIDLKATGEGYGDVTPNDSADADSGPNNLQNFMALAIAEPTGHLVGTLEGSNNPYTIDIYQIDSCDGSGFGEGGSNLIKTYTQSTTGGVLNFDELIAPAPPLGSYLLTLVTDADGNTSEFGNCVQVVEATFVIDSVENFADNNAGDGVCESVGTGVCTLRAVIEEVNALGGGPYAISFDFGGLGSGLPRVIEPTSALPTITTPVIIDASTMANAACPTSDSAANHRLILDGTNVATGDGLRLAASASGSTIRGLHIRNFPDSGVQVDGDDNVIACNTLENNTLHGVNVNGNNNRIGGTARSERNVVIYNGKWGVRLGNSATLNKVQGNYIGVEGDGTTAAGNGDSGVFLSGGGSNRIGGSAGFAANVISDNGVHGIEIDAGDGSNQIWGNIIGLDAAGSTALGNNDSGIYVNSANANEIGGDSDSKGNVIAANGGDGIFLNSSSNVVQRNIIGTDISGLQDLGNTSAGIRVVDGDNNVIGGDIAADGNLIAGNTGSGIHIGGNAVATTIRYNDIGVNAGGNPLGNTLNGIRLAGLVSQAEVRNNTIAHNGKDGIAVSETVILSNFAANEIYDNGELGIDLNNDDDSNDGDSGANGLMNFPVIYDANADNNTVSIVLNSLAPRSYRIHVYRNQSCDSSGYGEGQRYLGSFVVETVPGNSVVNETAVLPFNFNAGDQITATATPLTSPITDGTSEFSSCFTATGSATTALTWGGQQVGFIINTTSGMQPALDRINDAWALSAWGDCPTCAPAAMHLVPFKDSAAHLGSTDDADQFGDWLGMLTASGGGACPDATFAGLYEFGVNLSDESAPVSDAIVFSDSPPTGNRQAFGLLLSQLIDRGIRVHNVGYTLCSNANLPDYAMNYLTLLSGGDFYSPASTGEYITDAQMAMNLALSQDLIGNYVGTLDNSVATFPIEIDSSVTTLGVDYHVECPTCTGSAAAPLTDMLMTSGDISVELIDPNGNVVDGSMPGYQHLSTSTHDVQMLFETVNASDAGSWQLRVSGNGQYAINVFGDSGVHMTAVGQHSARVNKSFQVRAFIAAEEGVHCGSGCNPVTATLKLVGLDNLETFPVAMFNMGMPSSVYGGSVTVPTPGLYRLVAEGTLEDGTQFMRVDPTPIRVRAHAVNGSGDASAVSGSTRSISFELINDASADATTFDLALFSELGWTATGAIPESVTLAAGESVVYTIDVVIPSDAETGLIEESSFVAVPQDDLSASVSVSAKTSVMDQPVVFLPLVIR